MLGFNGCSKRKCVPAEVKITWETESKKWGSLGHHGFKIANTNTCCLKSLIFLQMYFSLILGCPEPACCSPFCNGQTRRFLTESRIYKTVFLCLGYSPILLHTHSWLEGYQFYGSSWRMNVFDLFGFPLLLLLWHLLFLFFTNTLPTVDSTCSLDSQCWNSCY